MKVTPVQLFKERLLTASTYSPEEIRFSLLLIATFTRYQVPYAASREGSY